MIYIYYKIDVDNDNYLYQILFRYTCMLRIGCKHMILITFHVAKIYLKVIKVL
jgi:hypothetical protein